MRNGTVDTTSLPLVLVPGLNNTHAVFDGLCAALPERIHAHALDNPYAAASGMVQSVPHPAEALPHRPLRFSVPLLGCPAEKPNGIVGEVCLHSGRFYRGMGVRW